jgi:hypothetical protein
VKYFVDMGLSTTRPFEFIHVQSPGNGALFLSLSALIAGVGSATVFSSAAMRTFRSASCCSVVCGVLGEVWVAGVACADALFPAAAKQTSKANPVAMADFEQKLGIFLSSFLGGHTSTYAFCYWPHLLVAELLVIEPVCRRRHKDGIKKE